MANKILLSIKPKFAELILNGEKKYEFRRVLPAKLQTGDTIVMYASAPVSAVVGEFRVYGSISNTPETVWIESGAYGGISKEFFDQYFDGREIASAILVGEEGKVRYKKVLPLSSLGISRPPQSFCYIKEGVAYE